MSSHREAPGDLQGPGRRQHRRLRLRQPGPTRHRHADRQLHPAARRPTAGPNFYEFGDDVLYEIHIVNDGDAHADITYQFRFHTDDPQPRHVPLQHRPDHVARQPELEPAAVLLGHPGRRAARQQGAGHRTWPARRCNVGPRSTPNYAQLAAQAVHDARRRREGLRRPARRRVPRRPRQRSSTSARCGRSRTCT